MDRKIMMPNSVIVDAATVALQTAGSPAHIQPIPMAQVVALLPLLAIKFSGKKTKAVPDSCYGLLLRYLVKKFYATTVVLAFFAVATATTLIPARENAL
ncbi:MAG TPA: hypothetical protein VEG28_05770, partial [Dehalococcoidia bacterium]|nr:hypothetical protein [Dehalococcoidia bacterium]